jgi:hypothetical protein
MAKQTNPEPESLEPVIDTRAIYAVVSDRGDSTGPLTKTQANRELKRLQRDSDEDHAGRAAAMPSDLGEAGDPMPPERYSIVELDPDVRLRHASRMARGGDHPFVKGVDAGLGDEEVDAE